MKSVGWDLIFDLNSLLRKNGQWSPDNAIMLLEYTVDKGYKVAGWELGNGESKYKPQVVNTFYKKHIEIILKNSCLRILLGTEFSNMDVIT